MCSHLSEKVSKGRFLKLENLQNHSNEVKGKEKKKEQEEGKEEKKKKSNGCTLSFYNSYFGWKQLFDAKGPFGDNVIKNPARYTIMHIMYLGNFYVQLFKSLLLLF